MPLRVVFDTNVLFSAVGWGGVPGQCVDLARNGQIQGLTSVEILEELSEKLALKLQFSEEDIEIVVGSLLSFLEVIIIAGVHYGIQPDAKDDKILETAAVGTATHIVNGDRKHLLPLKSFRNIPVVSPAELIKLVSKLPT